MIFKVVNNFSTTLASALAEGATTMVMTDGGANFDDASADIQYKLTLVKVETINNIPTETHREVVNVTNRTTGNELTVVRAREGTTQLPTEWPAGTKVVCRLTAEVPNDLSTRVETLEGAAPAVVATAPLDLTIADTATLNLDPPMMVESLELVQVEAGSAPASFSEVAGTPDTGSSNVIKFSNSGNYAVVMPPGSGSARFLDTSDPDPANWTLVHTIAIAYAGNGAAWSSDDSYVALAIGSTSNGTLLLIDTSDPVPTNWAEVTTYPTVSANVKGTHWAPDDSKLALVHIGGDGLEVWNTSDPDPANWTVDATTPALPGNGEDCKFNSAGAILACGHWSGDGYSLFDVSDWSPIATEALPAGEANHLAFSKDDSKLALSSWGGDNFYVLDMATLTIDTGTPTIPNPDIQGIDWSNDDSLVGIAMGGSGGNNIVVYDPSDWSVVYDSVDLGQYPGRCDFKPGAAVVFAVPFRAVPGLFVATKPDPDYPKVNLGTDGVTDPDGIAANQAISELTKWDVTNVAYQAGGVGTLYVEVSDPKATGGKTKLVARGYQLSDT